MRGFNTCNQKKKNALHCVHRDIEEGQELTWDYGDEFCAVLEEKSKKDATAEESLQTAATALSSLNSAAGAGAGAGASAHTHFQTHREREREKSREREKKRDSKTAHTIPSPFDRQVPKRSLLRMKQQ